MKSIMLQEEKGEQLMLCLSRDDCLKRKLYMCLMDVERAFGRVLRKVLEWAMGKKGIPESVG